MIPYLGVEHVKHPRVLAQMFHSKWLQKKDIAASPKGARFSGPCAGSENRPRNPWCFMIQRYSKHIPWHRCWKLLFILHLRNKINKHGDLQIYHSYVSYQRVSNGFWPLSSQNSSLGPYTLLWGWNLATETGQRGDLRGPTLHRLPHACNAGYLHPFVIICVQTHTDMDTCKSPQIQEFE